MDASESLAPNMLAPNIFRPHAALERYIDFYGYWDRRAPGVHRSRALPRGALTVVFDVGGSNFAGNDEVGFFAADGVTRAAPAPAFAVGAGTQSFVTCMTSPQAVLTVHFKPAGARPFIGMPADELRDRCVGVDELWGRAAMVLRERLVEEPDARRRVVLVESFLLARMRPDRADAVVWRTLSAVDANPSLRVSDLRDAAGLPAKAFSAAFRAHVGVTPKAYLRVRRLQSALRRLDGRGVLGADLAAELGYFDQPHFVREFRALAQTTPTEYVRSRSVMRGHVDLAD